jgi:cytochrome c oxidase cbb3-type subunit 3
MMSENMNTQNNQDGPEVDEFTGVETTGHEWDGIKELNNPMPRWWLWTFYLTIIFAVGYSFAYPSIPLIKTSTKGFLNWSSRGDVANELAAAKASQAGNWDKLADIDVNDIAADVELQRFSVAGGNAAFKINCVQCHGSGAQGSPGFPNLNDDDWIWGGTLDEIYLTINHGIRYEEDDDTRYSDMPAYGTDELLEKEQISDVAWFVRKLSKQEFDAEAAARGEATYVENCAACHGDAGLGDRELGAPRLSDALWLYGGSHEEIVKQITKPQQGVMPAWGERLGVATSKQLAVYIHSLGGGE